MGTRTTFTQAHLDNMLWINELKFFREELNIYQTHFEEMVSRNTSLQSSDEAAFFTNQFARFADMADLLQKDLIIAEKNMAVYARSNQTADLEEVIVADHFQLKNRVNAFKEDYQDIKNKYRQFESEL